MVKQSYNSKIVTLAANFFTQFTNIHNKLECLSLASLSSLV